MSELPIAVATSEIRFGPFVAKVYVLDNGQAVIDQEGFASFLAWLENPSATEEEVARVASEFAQWLRHRKATFGGAP